MIRPPAAFGVAGAGRAAALVLTTAAFLLPAGSAAAAAPAPTEITHGVAFDNLVPGETRTQTTEVVVPTGVLVASEWASRTGLLASASLDVVLCRPDEACQPAASLIGEPVAAGPVEVEVTVTVPTDAAPGVTGAAVGVLTFQGADDIATTGVDASAWVAAVAAGGLLVGAGIVLRASRARAKGGR